MENISRVPIIRMAINVKIVFNERDKNVKNIYRVMEKIVQVEVHQVRTIIGKK